LSVERPILSRPPDSPSGATRLRDCPALQPSYLSTRDRGAGHKGTYLGAQYTRLRGRRGPRKATGALRHSILIAAYHILDQNTAYRELGADYFDRRSTDQRTKRLVRQLEKLGHTVTLEPLAA